MHLIIYILIAGISFLFIHVCRYTARRILRRRSCCTAGDSCPCARRGKGRRKRSGKETVIAKKTAKAVFFCCMDFLRDIPCTAHFPVELAWEII